MKDKNMWHCFLDTLKKYAELKGRATRKEYWSFSLFCSVIVFSQYIVFLVLYYFSVSHRNNDLIILLTVIMFAIYCITCIFLYIPHIAVTIRRLHDTNHKSWWIWVPVYNLVLTCRRSDASDNRFGPHPERAVSAPSQEKQPMKTEPVVPLTHDVLALLEKLGRLREQGIITEEEFQEQKRKII